MKKTVMVAALVLLGGMTLGMGKKVDPSKPPLQVGDTAPAFRLTAVSAGQEFRFDSLRNIRIRNWLIFFGPHDLQCSYCNKLYSHINRDVNQYANGQRTGVALLVGDGIYGAAQIARRYKLHAISVVGDRSGKTLADFGMAEQAPKGIQARLGVMLVNRDNEVVFSYVAPEGDTQLPWKEIYAAVARHR